MENGTFEFELHTMIMHTHFDTGGGGTVKPADLDIHSPTFHILGDMSFVFSLRIFRFLSNYIPLSSCRFH